MCNFMCDDSHQAAWSGCRHARLQLDLDTMSGRMPGEMASDIRILVKVEDKRRSARATGSSGEVAAFERLRVSAKAVR
jgi:hypothetical protein